MKKSASRFILVVFDVLAIYVSIVLAYYFRDFFSYIFDSSVAGNLSDYTHKLIIYIIIIMSFVTVGIYKHRRDFWEETYFVLKALVLSLILILSVLALSKSIESYSRAVIVGSFIFMGILIPIVKFILKKKLSVFGLWSKNVAVATSDSEVINEMFSNRYLGYKKSTLENSDIVIIDSIGLSPDDVDSKLMELSHKNKEIIFIPILNSFNFARARIIELFNSRSNMIVLENSLLKKRNIVTKRLLDLLLSLLLVPLLIPIFTIIILLMKKREPNGSIFFKQKRIGKDENVFVCYKFRSMLENGDELLQEYLKEHPEEVESYAKYHKYINDPRITKLGAFLRRTSLDELPQIINVFKGEMSLIGPRPYMLNEKEKIGSRIEMVVAVKPGITGLWQVSGRSGVDFHSRVDMDVYYTRNWNLWMDVVIFFKTIKTVLFREGAS
jgi:undecaprenyl-phosphate galactose phosphotransferase